MQQPSQEKLPELKYPTPSPLYMSCLQSTSFYTTLDEVGVTMDCHFISGHCKVRYVQILASVLEDGLTTNLLPQEIGVHKLV